MALLLVLKKRTKNQKNQTVHSFKDNTFKKNQKTNKKFQKMQKLESTLYIYMCIVQGTI